MSYSVVLTDHFKKEAKKLSKKYRSLKAELKALGDELAENPTTGVHLGHDLYKVRLAMLPKAKGSLAGSESLLLSKWCSKRST